MEYLFLLPLVLFIGLIPAYIAYVKGRSFGKWFLYSVLVFPVALVHIIMLDSREPCPSCKEMIKPDAMICPFCHL